MKKGKQHKYSFRVTEKQHEFVESICETAGITASAYFRKLIDSYIANNDLPHVDTKEEREYKRQLINEVNKIGVNINQIVRNVNSNFYSRDEKARLFELVGKVYALIEKRNK